MPRKRNYRMKLLSDGSVEVPRGFYALGDPGYNISNEDWGRVLKETNFFASSPIGSCNDFDFLAFSTYWGDGIYEGPEGMHIGVDSGRLGLVPVDWAPHVEDHYWCTAPVYFNKKTICKKEGSVLIFGKHRIETNYLGTTREELFGEKEEVEEV